MTSRPLGCSIRVGGRRGFQAPQLGNTIKSGTINLVEKAIAPVVLMMFPKKNLISITDDCLRAKQRYGIVRILPSHIL